MPIALQDTITRSNDVLFAEIGAETVLMSEANSKYYGLTATSREIWKHLDKPIAVSDLLESLSNKYKIPTSAIENDVLEFLDHLIEKGILKIE